MIRRSAFALALILTPGVLLPSTLRAQDDVDRRPGLVVFQFDNGGSHGDDAEAENMAALEVGLQQMFITELAQNPELRIVERAALQEILEEQGLATGGRVDVETAVRVGRIVGARYALAGQFTDWFGTMRMDARIIDVETTETIRSRQVTDDREALFRMVVDLAALVTDQVDLPELPAPVREARREREIPTEAVTLYSRALVYQDAGRTDQARELLQRITTDFPDFVEARESLQQLPTG